MAKPISVTSLINDGEDAEKVKNWGAKFQITPLSVQKQGVSRIITQTVSQVNFDINLPNPGLVIIECIGLVNPTDPVSQVEYGFFSGTFFPLGILPGEAFSFRFTKRAQTTIWLRSRTAADEVGFPLYVEFGAFDV